MIRMILMLGFVGLLAWPASAEQRKTLVFQAEQAEFAPGRVVVVDRPGFQKGKGAMLSRRAPARLEQPAEPADLTFSIKIEVPGRYWIATVAATCGEARRKMERSRNKHDALRVKLAVGDDVPRRPVVVFPWKNQDADFERLGKCDFTAGEHLVKLWLPEEVAIDRLEIIPYRPPAVPEAARSYAPAVVPPAGHPRLWVTAETLPQVRANLAKPENRPIWEKVRAAAAKPVRYEVKPGVAGAYDPAVQEAASHKAFVALMTGDAGLAREAAELIYAYMSKVEFDNMLDITRELGSAIYAGALVYDWCYDYLSVEQRRVIREALLRLAEDMEIGWPPFGQIVVNGHGNEAQVNRDLLSMGIALYGDDDVPYHYCAYRLFEELIPLRAREYRSSRHNQGIGYAAYRFNYEMHAAWLLRRLAGRELFDPNLKTVYDYFLYGRMPDGSMMLDGDGSYSFGVWHSPPVAFMCYSYAGSPVYKHEFMAVGPSAADPLLFLLLNDPDLAPDGDYAKLPLTRYFPEALASMVARTGWNFGRNSDDVFVEMKGGTFNFANHQHLDAGAFQIYYRGVLATDLGMYGFYGTPYDLSFNKRSIPHNLMLVYDRDEKFPARRLNDGGQRTIPRCPVSLADLETNAAEFRVGETVAADFGPDAKRPLYSYLKSDLAAAYSDKVAKYARTFCFLNLGRYEEPAVLITVDRMETARPEQKKYWSINSFTEPAMTPAGLEILSPRRELPGKLTVRMLAPAEFDYEVCGGEKLHDIFGARVEPPVKGALQSGGFRTMFSPKQAATDDLFIVAMQISGGDVRPEPVAVLPAPGEDHVLLAVADYAVLLGTSYRPAGGELRLSLPAAAGGGARQVLLADLAAGNWNLSGGKLNFNFTVEKEKSTAFFLLPAGEYRVKMGADPNARSAAKVELPAPEIINPLAGRIRVGDRVLDAAPLVVDGRMLLPAAAVFDAMGGLVAADGEVLTVKIAGRLLQFRAGSDEILLSGDRIAARAATRRADDGAFLVDAAAAAELGGHTILENLPERSALLLSRPDDGSGVIRIVSNCGFDRAALKQLGTDDAGKTHYWAVNGQDKWFELTYGEPKRLSGIGIRWSQGVSRLARFKLEVSDGQGWKTVHEGNSLKQNALEHYSFAPQKVRQVRFTGYGNSSNSWNSIVSFVPLEAKR